MNVWVDITILKVIVMFKIFNYVLLMYFVYIYLCISDLFISGIFMWLEFQ